MENKSKSFRRFLLNRIYVDSNNNQPVGTIFSGVLSPNGKVFIEGKEGVTITFDSLEIFEKVHVNKSHKIIWIDRENGWYCFSCGSGGMEGNFCQMCGNYSTGYISPWQDILKSKGRCQLERELDKLNQKMSNALSLQERARIREIVELLSSNKI